MYFYISWNKFHVFNICWIKYPTYSFSSVKLYIVHKLRVCVIRMQYSQNMPTRQFRTVTKSKDLTHLHLWVDEVLCQVHTLIAPCVQENSIWWKRLDISVSFHIRVTNKWSAKGGSCDRTMTRESCTVSTDQPVNSPCLVPLCQYRAISAALR